MIITEYKRPQDFSEVFALLNSHKNAQIIAGGLFLRLTKASIPLVIDISGLGLDKIEDKGEYYQIGAMVTLREIEKSTILPKGLINSVKQISGVGTRNLATIGGSVCGRYPFSDINTALMACSSNLEFYQNKNISIEEYFNKELDKKDLLIYIKVPKSNYSNTKFYKQVYTDFSLVNVSICDKVLSVGARPSRSVCIRDFDVRKSAKDILKEVEFTTDYKASGEYRRVLAETLLEDLITEMEE